MHGKVTFNHKTTAYNKRLLERSNKKYLNEVKQLKNRILHFHLVKEISVDTHYDLVNLIKTRDTLDLVPMLYSINGVNVFFEEGPKKYQLLHCIKKFTGVRIP